METGYSQEEIAAVDRIMSNPDVERAIRSARRWKLISICLAAVIPIMGLLFSGISTSFQYRGVRALESIAAEHCK